MTGEEEPCTCGKGVREKMPDDDTVMDLADLFRIFSDSTRVRILCALRCNEMCVQGIAECCGISMSVASHSLKTLKNADLVSARRNGKQIFYSLCDEHVEVLLDTALTHLKEE